jgi:hypothetical protein
MPVAATAISATNSRLEIADQIEELKYVTDLAAAHNRASSLGEVVESLAQEMDLAACRPVESTEEVQQGGLSAAARPHDGDEFAAHNIEINPIDGAVLALARREALCDTCAVENNVGQFLSMDGVGWDTQSRSALGGGAKVDIGAGVWFSRHARRTWRERSRRASRRVCR